MKWPILDTRTNQLSKQRLGKVTAWQVCVFNTFSVTSFVNSGYSRLEVVCHLLSSCVHASITSKSDSKIFVLSDKFQRCAVVREGKESQKCSC